MKYWTPNWDHSQEIKIKNTSQSFSYTDAVWKDLAGLFKAVDLIAVKS